MTNKTGEPRHASALVRADAGTPERTGGGRDWAFGLTRRRCSEVGGQIPT